MEFFSLRFLVFFPPLLLMLSLVRLTGRDRLGRLLITLASLFFYAAWDWRYLFLLLAISAMDFSAALCIEAASSAKARRFWLTLSIVANLGVLGYFKYADFFLANIGADLLKLVLPAGISFYTFKTMSYTIDVYRGELRACRSWLDYAMFVSFFPDLIAGPIVRAAVFLPQLRERRVGPTLSNLLVGANIFCQGLTKKLLLADRLGTVASPVFAEPVNFSTGAAWMGLLAFAGQIFCDFSGYSDMAIGTARMLGYDLPLNFGMPYLSRSLSEFWSRWHVTLSNWLRDYLYIPLGGNRGGSLLTYRNLLLTMMLGGLWHGANWTFLLWGLWHGLGLCLQRYWSQDPARRLPAPLSWCLTQLFVLLAWVPFRCRDWTTTWEFCHRLLGRGGLQGQSFISYWFWICLALMIAGHLVGTRLSNFSGRWGLGVVELPLAGSYLCLLRPSLLTGYLATMWLGLMIFFLCTQATPFLYFQF